VTDRRRPGRLVRRHFGACVFSCLAAELRSGDVAVAGSESYASFADQLLSWEECEPLAQQLPEERARQASSRCGGPAAWPEKKVDVLKRWIESGFQPWMPCRGAREE
jgi:hypothetical protein